MTWLTDLSLPHCEVVDGGLSVHVRVGAHDDGILVSTAAEADRLADELRKAAHHLREVDRIRQDRADREAAKDTNLRFSVRNHSWPGKTLPAPFTSQAPATTETKVIPIQACTCDHANCTHGGEVA